MAIIGFCVVVATRISTFRLNNVSRKKVELEKQFLTLQIEIKKAELKKIKENEEEEALNLAILKEQEEEMVLELEKIEKIEKDKKLKKIKPFENWNDAFLTLIVFSLFIYMFSIIMESKNEIALLNETNEKNSTIIIDYQNKIEELERGKTPKIIHDEKGNDLNNPIPLRTKPDGKADDLIYYL